jgi:hypothetical protein
MDATRAWFNGKAGNHSGDAYPPVGRLNNSFKSSPLGSYITLAKLVEMVQLVKRKESFGNKLFGTLIMPCNARYSVCNGMNAFLRGREGVKRKYTEAGWAIHKYVIISTSCRSCLQGSQ